MKARISIRDAAASARISEEAKQLAEEFYQKEISRISKREAMAEVKRAADAVDSIILFVLHDEFGFGKDRLVRFLRRYKWMVSQLIEQYDFDDGYRGVAWYCRKELEKIGVIVDDTASDAED